MKNLCKISSIIILLTLATPTHANLLFDFTYNSNHVNATGRLTTTELQNGVYTILSASGTINGTQIAGVAPAGFFLNLNFQPDYALYPSGALVDAQGFILQTLRIPAGLTSTFVQIEQDPILASALPNDYFYWDFVPSGPFDGTYAQGSLSITPAPTALPAAVWLFGSALLAVYGYSRKTEFNKGARLAA